MSTSRPPWRDTIQPSDLESIVGQILEQPILSILDWSIQPITGGASEYVAGGLGVYVVTGTARQTNRGAAPWSVVVKTVRPSRDADTNNPIMWNYWKREILAFQSGILKELPGNLVAPRCYAVQETPNGTFLIWIEDIHEIDDDWTMDHYRLAARHLGQFNGAYLVDYPLPDLEPWMMPGRTHQFVELFPPNRKRLLESSESPITGRWLSVNNIDRILRLWQHRKSLLTKLDQLPTCFCHHDAFRRNLMLRRTDQDTVETVAIDWQLTGPGKVGQETGTTIGATLLFMGVSASRARELDEAIFAGYSAGLQDAGWQGDLWLARFGYTATAALTFGVAPCVWAVSTWVEAFMSGQGDLFEAVLGCSIGDTMAQWAEALPFLLDLGDEAIHLAERI